MIRAALAAAAILGTIVIAVFPPDTEARILISAMTLLAWIFALAYGLRSPWRSTQAGRSVMATTVAIALMGTQLASVWWFGNYPGRAEIRSVVLLSLALTLLHRLLVWWKLQHEDDHREPRSDLHVS